MSEVLLGEAELVTLLGTEASHSLSQHHHLVQSSERQTTRSILAVRVDLLAKPNVTVLA